MPCHSTQVKVVKQLYKDLNLEKVFRDYEDATYAELMDLIKKEAKGVPEKVFMDFAQKIFRRQK
jgi:farnesyl diphosphate synthase